jgi:hypothetical protein
MILKRYFSSSLTKYQLFNKRLALRELIEDSPYKFENTKEPSGLPQMKKIADTHSMHITFKTVYQQFL